MADIKYKTKSQRKYVSFLGTFCYNWDYHKLDRDERNQYEMHKYEEFVGREKIEEALLKAWEMVKPNFNEIFNT